MSRSHPYKMVTLGNVRYSINEEEKTASVTRIKCNVTDITLPRSIKHESKEYIVTSISSGAFYKSNVRSISFDPNSELRTIEEYALCNSNVEIIRIPASVVELKDGWCCETKYLNQVEVESGNVRYSSVCGKYIIGKSDINQEDYDTLVVCARDTTEIKIPSNIKIISAYAFSDSKVSSIQIPCHVTQICEYAFDCCEQLSRVEFEPNSELRIIEKEAFSESSIESIQIPSHVTKICEYAFISCKQLSRVEFGPNSELRTIEKDAFFGSKLARIRIPARVVELKDGWCSGIGNLNQVEVESGNVRYSSVCGKYIIGKSDISQEDYDTLVVCARDTTEMKIPSNINIIGAYAFSNSKISSIQIPCNVTRICENAFMQCKQLSRVEFEPNSELRIIENHAFSCTSFERIQIPSRVAQICEGVFTFCKQLSQVEFEPNSELQIIENHAFSDSSIESILIPSHVTQICDGVLSQCSKLSRVEFEPNSELQTIGEHALCNSKVASIQIPASVVELKDGWCNRTKYLNQVEVESGNVRYSSVCGKYIIGKSDISQEDYDTLVVCARDTTEMKIPSTIKIICAHAFSDSKVRSIQIPCHVTRICENTFTRCELLSRVEFEPNSELRIIEKEAFSESSLASIQIPSSVTQISEDSFLFCKQLSRVVFEPNSELRTIEKGAFSFSKLTSIQIPSSVTKIHGSAFSYCKQLQIAEIDEKLADESFDMGTFACSAIVMIPARKKLH